MARSATSGGEDEDDENFIEALDIEPGPVTINVAVMAAFALKRAR